MLKYCFKTTLPVLFGYLPLGMAFGILFQTLGYPWIFATLMSVFVFAGAAQFIAVGMLAASASLFEIALTTLILNARHIFYGLSMLSRFKEKGLKKFYMTFTLTDETYSLITSIKPPEGENKSQFYFLIGLLNHSYWVLGTTIGALLGEFIDFNTDGMAFALTALFTVLLIEQYRSVKQLSPFVMALFCGVFALLVFSQHAFVISIGLAVGLLLLNGRRLQWT